MIFLEYNADGLVTNAIVYDGEEPYTPPDGLSLVERGDSEAWIGWTYDGQGFTPPPEQTVFILYHGESGFIVRQSPEPFTDEAPEGFVIAEIERPETEFGYGWTYDPEAGTLTPPN